MPTGNSPGLTGISTDGPVSDNPGFGISPNDPVLDPGVIDIPITPLPSPAPTIFGPTQEFLDNNSNSGFPTSEEITPPSETLTLDAGAVTEVEQSTAATAEGQPPTNPQGTSPFNC